MYYCEQLLYTGVVESRRPMVRTIDYVWLARRTIRESSDQFLSVNTGIRAAYRIMLRTLKPCNHDRVHCY